MLHCDQDYIDSDISEIGIEWNTQIETLLLWLYCLTYTTLVSFSFLYESTKQRSLWIETVKKHPTPWRIKELTTALTISLGVWARWPALTQWVCFGDGVCRPLLAACDPAPGGEDRRCHCRHRRRRLCSRIWAFVWTGGRRRAAPYRAAVI